MEYSTSRLCDKYLEQVDVLDPILFDFGGEGDFSGQITTVKCFESNGLIAQVLAQDGLGRVLLVDGGGSLRRALIDVELAELAYENNWAGIVLYGAVRDVAELASVSIGIKALGSIPVGAEQNSIGDNDIPVNFAGVTFFPDDFIYADETGIILSQDDLSSFDDENEEDDEDDDFEDDFDEDLELDNK